MIEAPAQSCGCNEDACDLDGQMRLSVQSALVLPEGFTFDPVAHRYGYAFGMEIPSVTKILEAAGLAPDFSKVPRRILSAAAERGDDLHACLRFAMDGDLDWSTVREDYQPVIFAALEKLEERGHCRIASECPLVDEERGFAGTPDDVCFLDGALAIRDDKSGKNPIGYVAAQLSAYSHLVEKSLSRAGIELPAAPKLWHLRLDYRKGSSGAKLRPLTEEESQQGDLDFMAAEHCFRRRKKDCGFWRTV